MTNLYFGCDVDLTICPSDIGWKKYLINNSSQEDMVAHYKLEKVRAYFNDFKLPYNLGEIFTSVQNPMDYWKDLDYSQFEPLEGSVEALERISKHFGIVFISHIEGGEHGRSKCNWLKKHYPFLTGISYTREKFIHNNSVVAMVDDRLNHLKGFDFNKRVIFNTPYTQDVECEVYKTINSWKEVDSNFINDILRSK